MVTHPDDDGRQLMFRAFDEPPVPPRRIALDLRPCGALAAVACLCLIFGGVVAWAVYAAAHNDGPVVAKSVRDAWEPYAASFAHIANRSARACRDGLYAHVCGGWTGSGTSNFDNTNAGVRAQLQDIADDRWPLVGTWYEACMDGAARRTHGLDAIATVLPAISAVHNEDTWARAVAQLHAIGVDVLFSVYADVDDAGPGTLPQLLYIDETTPLLPVDTQAANGSFVAAQWNVLATLLTPYMAPADISRALTLDSAQIAPFVMSPAALRMRNRRNIVAASTLPGPFAWHTYWAARGMAPTNVSVAAPAYLETAAAQLAARNDWATLRAYLAARLYISLAADLPPQAGIVPAAGDCLASTGDAFGDTLGHLWVERNFPANTTRPAVEAMVRTTIAAFGRRIDALSWMDEATRAAAHAKLDAIHVMIGFPDAWDVRDPSFPVSLDDHLHNVIAARTAAVAENVAAAGTGANRYAWLMPAFAVNAYYEPTANDIVFPAGILRGPFYAPDAPLALNWGSLGVVIGHEISHGFDDQGRAYDAAGARRDWWTPASAAGFTERAACVASLYSALPGVGGYHVDGNLTLGENLADMGGLAVAYDAYKVALVAQYPSHKARRDYEHAVHAIFGVSHEQLFYAGFARMWCAAVPDDVAYRRLLTDPHSPPRWRVDTPTSQSAAYAAAYGCPPPAAPCVVW